MYVGKYESSKEFLARDYEMKHLCFESQIYICCSKHDTWRSLEWTKAICYHFKVFGCIVYVDIPDEKKKKLDNKSGKCVFFKISKHSKAYKLFNPTTKKIVISPDVVFNEEST